MILEIRLSNFFSIKDEVTLDMQAATIQSKKGRELDRNVFECDDERLLKSIAIYGANASGKSSVIKAIRFCISMIIQSHNNNENAVFNFKPFKFEGYAEKPSHFSIRFLLDAVEYEYSFTLTQTEIITEELYYYPNGRRSQIFTRDERKGSDKKEIYDFKTVIKRPMGVAANTSRKTLFISRASQMDRDIAKEIFCYFDENFILDFSRHSTLQTNSLIRENKDVLLKALQIADSDITDIRIRQELRPYAPAVVDVFMVQEEILRPQLIITTYHKRNPEIPFDFYTEESDGTQILFNMMLTILHVVRQNKILLIDEIETSLHCKLVEYIVSLFHNSHHAQLIYTTHNTYLLDMNKIRKDQVYFVNKKEDASSDLYSLYDFKDFRDTMDLEKAYLQGRFDAIPYIDDTDINLKQLF